MRYFLGVDLGGTKTRAVIADESGEVAGVGVSGPGNHQSVGYEKMHEALHSALIQALNMAEIPASAVEGIGYGLAGYDWETEAPRTRLVLDRLPLQAPFIMVNDTSPGLVAGAESGWGVVVISGTGCNCRGWDKDRKREGRVTGFGVQMGENAGATELIFRAMQLVGYSWAKRLPPTRLSDLFIDHVGAKDILDLLRGYTEEEYFIDSEVAPRIFETAEAGDQVARELIHWAGCELGEMANGVIRQLNFEDLSFDVVLSGSMFDGGQLLVDPMRETIHSVAPGARLLKLTVPPVVGSVLIGMSAGQHEPSKQIRKKLVESIKKFSNVDTL